MGIPSVAKMTTACCPLERSCCAAGSISDTSCITDSVSGVVPPGDELMIRRITARSIGWPAVATSALAPSCAIVKNWPTGRGLSRWKSVLAFSASAIVPTCITVSASSSHRVARTIRPLPCASTRQRFPSPACIEPLLSTTKKRTGKTSCAEVWRFFTSPGGNLSSAAIASWTDVSATADCLGPACATGCGAALVGARTCPSAWLVGTGTPCTGVPCTTGGGYIELAAPGRSAPSWRGGCDQTAQAQTA